MRYVKTTLALAIPFMLSITALAAECCKHCGCSNGVQKTCRLTVETKKVPEIKYSVECEDFCVPGPSKQQGCKCEKNSDGCEKCKPNMVPQCAQVYTRTKLVKKTTEKEVQVYKWVVEDLCPHCESGVKSVSIPAGTKVPAPPADAVKK